MQFEPCTPVYDACRIIRERVPEAQAGQGWWTTQRTEFTWWKSKGVNICMLCFTLCYSVRLRPLPVRRWSQERNLARVWANPGLLHAAKWSKMKSYSLWWRPVNVTRRLLKWFTFSSPEMFMPPCLLEATAVFCAERPAGSRLSLCFLSCLLRMSWSTRRNKGRKRSKCWMVQLKPSWWMTRKQSGSCLSPYAAE